MALCSHAIIIQPDFDGENMGDEVQCGVVYCGEIQCNTLQHFATPCNVSIKKPFSFYMF